MKEEISKYYTPNLDEFHLGFEYRFSSAYQEGVSTTEITIDGREGYEPMIFDLNVFNYRHPNKGESWKDVLESMLLHDQIKVKYLDKDDIESFGFKCVEEKDYMLSFSKPWYNKSELILRYYIWYTGLTDSDEFTENRKIHIYQTKGTPIIYKHNNLEDKIDVDRNIFLGTIKNKSEFKVLLKQLDINE